ncbi:hypothetical protein DY000_02052667 [Brassica cretica]|uniref:Uncharacterized protein n=1 Tax=Brassica cretica TaxID=69181 RepID=A0ABQ7AAP6_BRACR|nr:hypothetical protein DY000_02052667 [Brassica cretica]
MAVRAPISLDNALHRASYFATHKEEVAALKKQYSANKNNAAKKTNAPKEPASKGQHSYAINNSPEYKLPTNRETELESPSSPPPAPKKRVDMISWGPKRNIPNKIEGQTEGKVCIDITVAIRTLEDLNRASPPQYNPNTKTPFSKIPKLK